MLKIQLNLVLLLSICVYWTLAVSCPGCVDLDDISFNHTLKRFPYAIVKFDIAFPYDEKHTAYGAFSTIAYGATDQLLVATVGIKDYGEMENKNLGLRFGYHNKNLPGILLFKAGNYEQPITYPSYLDVTTEHLKKFINENTNIYIGCDGCLKDFNVAIKNYGKLLKEQQLEIIKELQNMSEQLTKVEDKKYAKMYINFAQKIHADGYKFVDAETQRLLRIKAGRVTEEKKNEIQQKLNILDIFQIGNIATKTEL